jgi:hypothetical protein
MGSEIVVCVNSDGAVRVEKVQATTTVLGVLVAVAEVGVVEAVAVVQWVVVEE